jgi:iron complex outermembrane recepter protein
MIKLTVAALLAAMVVVPVAADAEPTSLRMRARPRRLAQPPADPAGDPPPPTHPADDPAADATPGPDPGPTQSPDPGTPTPPPAPNLSAPDRAKLAEVETKAEVITVTGSTTERALFTGRAPTSVVTRADIVASGRATLGDILQALPSQSNAANAQVNAGGDGTTRLNLRGLGVSRTLVLLNGRRVVNGGPGADSAVDLNAIPLAMIERVEVIKDGASTRYGADAIGGVINLITRPKFDGAEASLLTSTSQRGDGTEYDASLVVGGTTDNQRTYFVFGGGYQRHQPVFAGDRAFSSFQRSYGFANKAERRIGSLAVPGGRLDASSIDVTGTGMPTGLHLPGCPSDVCKADRRGGWTDFVVPDDLYNEAAGNYLYTPSVRSSFFVTGNHRFSAHSGIHVEMLYLHRDSSRELSPVGFVADAPISKDSLYNPVGGDILDFRRRIDELGPRRFIDDVTTVRLVFGFNGTVPNDALLLKGWTYEASYNFGTSRTSSGTTGQLYRPHVADALGPSMIDASGVPICVRKPGDASTQIIYVIRQSPGDDSQVPCVPVNLFAAPGTIPQAQVTNLTFNDAGFGINTMHTVLATAHGKIADLPNRGTISMAVGGDSRSEVGLQAPLVVARTGDTSDNAGEATTGDFSVLEGFADLSIVPITGDRIAKRLELDLGARVLRHNRYGTSLTYKVGGLFRTLHGISARGTYTTAYRAPSLPDLFRGLQERTPAAEDPCDTKPPSVGDETRTLEPHVAAQCAAQGVPAGARFNTGQQLAVVGGNPDLDPETAAITTVGVVLEPSQVPGLAISADYWHIAIDHAIESLGVQAIFAACFERGVQAFCDQIHRDRTTHRISPVDQLLQNVPRTTTSGVDLALVFDRAVPELGRFRTTLEAQYLRSYDLDTSRGVIHGRGFYDLGVYPRFKANLGGAWTHPSGASGGFTLRFVGTYKECRDNNCNSADNLAVASRDVDRYAKLDLFGGYDVSSRLGKTTLQVGINNLFDATPPLVYNAAAASSDAATYDFVGRLVYLRLSQRF